MFKTHSDTVIYLQRQGRKKIKIIIFLHPEKTGEIMSGTFSKIHFVLFWIRSMIYISWVSDFEEAINSWVCGIMYFTLHTTCMGPASTSRLIPDKGPWSKEVWGTRIIRGLDWFPVVFQRYMRTLQKSSLVTGRRITNQIEHIAGSRPEWNT